MSEHKFTGIELKLQRCREHRSLSSQESRQLGRSSRTQTEEEVCLSEQDLLRSNRKQEAGSQMQQEEQAAVYKIEPTVVTQTGRYVPALNTIFVTVSLRERERERKCL